MKTRYLLAALASLPLLIAAAAAPAPGGAAAPAVKPGSPIAPGEKPVKLGEGYLFTEGATSDKDGNVFFIDQDSNRIHKYNASTGKISIFLEPSNRSNGMCFDNNGNLLACADEKNEMWSIAAPFPPGDGPFKPSDLKITVLIKDLNGKLLNGPNDVWVIPTGPKAGWFYFTDPLYARKWWAGFRTNDMQQPGKYAYLSSPDGKTITPVVTDFNTPNGIIGTPDGKTLYVSDIAGNKTFQYTIKDDGSLADKKLFCNAGSDGMTIDSAGNVYTTAGNARTGVSIFDKTGKLVDSIPIGSANICIGGKDGNLLFINSRNDVWGVKLTTHRVGPQ